MASAGTVTDTRKRRGETIAAQTESADGSLPYDRRLSDKVLAAFNHAYASGARKVAARLRTVLADVERVERASYERRRSSALAQADNWVAFVEARERYNALVACDDASDQEREAALEAMKDAYRDWVRI